MTGDELLTYIRADVLHDTSTPRLWSDELFLRLLNEGERLFARRTYALQDDSSAFTTIDLEEGVFNYAIDPKVVHVYSAYLDGYSKDLTNYTHRFIPSLLSTSEGAPVVFTLDEAAKTLRVYPVPDKAYTLRLRIARLPLADITENTSPEIPEQYHIDLAEFVAMRCLRNAEVDGSNLGSAEVFEKSWAMRLNEAKREYYRLRTGPNATARNNWTGRRNQTWR